ncbi:dienelactone hydrolase family protein [Ferrovibrio terrae]|nr:dienelactone hydrolase family protein [Ferrovibrio terrae]
MRLKAGVWGTALALWLLTVALAPGSARNDARAQTREILEFTSPSRNGPVTVKAELFLPEGINGKMPAMVIHHGSGGVSNTREYAYAREFTKMGVASIVPDSFTPRGVKSTVEDQTTVSSNDMIADAFNALKLAAVHPRLDPDRIGITGFSKGGTVAMRTGLQIMVNRHVPNGPRFALHVPFYAGCDNMYLNMRTTGAPMLVLIGGADTYVGPQRCIDAVERMRAAGSKVDMVIYPNAQHGWDGVGRPWSYPNGENYSKCTYVEQADRRWVEQTTGLTTTGSDGKAVVENARKALAACKTLGVSGAPDEAVKAQSLEALKGAMKAAFKL